MIHNNFLYGFLGKFSDFVLLLSMVCYYIFLVVERELVNDSLLLVSMVFYPIFPFLERELVNEYKVI